MIQVIIDQYQTDPAISEKHTMIITEAKNISSQNHYEPMVVYCYVDVLSDHSDDGDV